MITGVSPTTGPINTQVTISGTGFGATQGTSAVSFGGTSAAVVSWSDTQVVATVPANAVTGGVVITNGGVNSNNNYPFTIPPPHIDAISPSSGIVGTQVTLSGSGFRNTGQITFNHTQGYATNWSDTQVVATVPANASTGSVQILVAGGNSNTDLIFTMPNPVINAVSPTTGPINTQVTVTGTGFGATQGSSTVSFGGSSGTVLSWSDTQVVATVLANAVTGGVVVTNGGVNSNNNLSFTIPSAHIDALSPTSGGAGTRVTITGSGFRNSGGVYFNSIGPAVVASWSDTQAVVSVPDNATSGPVEMVVTGGLSNTNVTFTVPNYMVSSVTPSSGPVGTTVSVSGSGFGASQGSSTVSFSGATASVSSWSDSQIVATVPDTAITGPVVVTINSVASNSTVSFTVPAPNITDISPSSGDVGTQFTITGTGFGPSSNDGVVTIDDAQASISSWSATQIVATIPSGASTGLLKLAVNGVISYGAIEITAPPNIDTVLPSAARIGTVVTVNGSHFGSGPTQGTITFGGVTVQPMSWTDSEIVLVLPNTVASGPVVVTASNRSTSAVNFNVLPQPGPGLATWHYTNNSFGEVLTATDPLGNVTTNTYDAHGNLLSVTAPAPSGTLAPSVTQFQYDGQGQLTQIIDPRNSVTKIAYNSIGLISSITDAQQNVTSYEYDARGNRTAVVDAMQNRTTFTYDTANELTAITYPDSTQTSFSYDYRGRRTSVTDQNSKATVYSYDAADRVTSVTDPASNITQYSYDTENNLTGITDALGRSTSFSYDAYGRVTQTTFPSTLVENYGYDAVGNLTSKTDRKRQTINYVYDALNRLTSKGYPDSTGVVYVYDAASHLMQVSDPTGTYGFTYDNMGRRTGTSTQYSFLPGHTLTNFYGYDADSNRTSTTNPDGSTNVYVYDTLNRLTDLTNSWAGHFGFGYDVLSRRTSLNRPNGVNTSYSYDSLSRLLGVLHQTGGTTIDGALYVLDIAGNRTSKQNLMNGVTEGYSYDNIYQLLGVQQGGNTTESYSYDKVGNRLSSITSVVNQYNSSNELTSDASFSYQYDNNGNMTSKTDANAATTVYSWDFENRLTSVALPGTGGTVSFRYDPFGQRVLKSSSSGTTVYAYDGAALADEYDANGNVLAQYAQGAGIDEPLAMNRAGTVAYYHADGLGSITSVTDITGSALAAYTRDSFGKSLNSAGTLVNPFRYTARESDSETGLYYYSARYYSSDTGRFISEDPVRILAGMNFYGYVLNNAPNLNDPSGHCPPTADDDCHKFADMVEAIARRILGSRPDTPGLDRRLFMDELAKTFTEFPGATLGNMSGAEGSSNQHVPRFGSSGFADLYFEQDVVLANGRHIPSNQVRHATGGLLTGYVLGTTPGLRIMNAREDPNDPIHGVPDINLNGQTVPMGNSIADPIGGDAAARGLADWIRRTLCK